MDFDKESGIIYGRRRDYAFYLETITDGDEFAIFFSVRCEQGYIGRDTLEALINDSEVLIDFERAGYNLACQILADQDRDLLPDILEEAIEDCTRYFEEKGLVSACEKPVKPEMWTCIRSKEIGSFSRHLAMSGWFPSHRIR